VGKRFIYACIAIIAVSVTSILLKYPAVEYLKMVGIISGIFTIGQSVTDHKKINNVG